jgi:DNA-binding MarR family transcriptional regulator
MAAVGIEWISIHANAKYADDRRKRDDPAVLDDRLNVFLAALLAGQAVSNLVRREFEAAGVSMTAWGLLVHVEEHRRVAPSQLAAETGVTATTIRDQVQSLVDRGALRRVPNPDDNRSYLVELTARGRVELRKGRAATAIAEALLERELGTSLADTRAFLLALRDAGRAALG